MEWTDRHAGVSNFIVGLLLLIVLLFTPSPTPDVFGIDIMIWLVLALMIASLYLVLKPLSNDN